MRQLLILLLFIPFIGYGQWVYPKFLGAAEIGQYYIEDSTSSKLKIALNSAVMKEVVDYLDSIYARNNQFVEQDSFFIVNYEPVLIPLSKVAGKYYRNEGRIEEINGKLFWLTEFKKTRKRKL